MVDSSSSASIATRSTSTAGRSPRAARTSTSRSWTGRSASSARRPASRPTAWRQLCRMTVSNSVTDQRGAIFLATGLVPGPATPDATEDLAIRWATLPEVQAEIETGRDPRPHDDRGRRRVRRRWRPMIEVRVLKVFVGPDGRGGNPLGVVLDGGARRRGAAAGRGGRARLLGDGVRRRRRVGRDPDLHARVGARVRRPPDRRHGLAAPGARQRWLAAARASGGRAHLAGRRPVMGPRPARLDPRDHTRPARRARGRRRAHRPARRRGLRTTRGHGSTRPRARSGRATSSPSWASARTRRPAPPP